MYTMQLTEFESVLLEGWEQVHAKSQMSLWILVAIRERNEFAEDIGDFIKTNANLDPEGQSLYRSLRRLEKATLITSRRQKSSGGPDKKQFSLTDAGTHVLEAFIQRNIVDIILRADTNGYFTHHS